MKKTTIVIYDLKSYSVVVGGGMNVDAEITLPDGPEALKRIIIRLQQEQSR